MRTLKQTLKDWIAKALGLPTKEMNDLDLLEIESLLRKINVYEREAKILENSKRPIVIQRARRLSDEERKMAFNVPVGGEPLWWEGLVELMEDCELDQIDLMSEAKLADKPGMLAHTAGGLDMIRTLRAELERRREDAQKLAEKN